MTVKEKIKSLLDEAAVYTKHGLFEEAKNNYKSVFLLLAKNKAIPNRAILIAGIKKKILALNKKTQELDKIANVSSLSNEARDIIKTKVFSFSSTGNKKDDVSSALDGGINLARFGQFEEALKEFRELFPLEPIRVEAAKNIMRCFMGLNDLDRASETYREWREKQLISDEQSALIFDYILNIPDKNGIRQELIDRLKDVDKKEPVKEPSQLDEFPELSDDLMFEDLAHDAPVAKSQDEQFNEGGFGSDLSDDLMFEDLTDDAPVAKSQDEQFNEGGFGSDFSDDLMFEDMGIEEKVQSIPKQTKVVPEPDDDLGFEIEEDEPEFVIEMDEPGDPEPVAFDEISINGMVLGLEKDSFTEEDEDEEDEFPSGSRFIDYVKASGNPKTEIPDDDVIEINSIGINIITGERAGEEINLDVVTQNGNQVSVLVSLMEQELLDCLAVGHRVNEIMCYSPIAIFSGYGIVVSKMVINSGPQKGNFGIDLRLKVE